MLGLVCLRCGMRLIIEVGCEICLSLTRLSCAVISGETKVNVAPETKGRKVKTKPFINIEQCWDRRLAPKHQYRPLHSLNVQSHC